MNFTSEHGSLNFSIISYKYLFINSVKFEFHSVLTLQCLFAKSELVSLGADLSFKTLHNYTTQYNILSLKKK